MYRQNEGFGLYFYATLALIWLNMNGLDSNVAPLIYGSLLPAAILIIVSFVCSRSLGANSARPLTTMASLAKVSFAGRSSQGCAYSCSCSFPCLMTSRL